MSLFRRQASIVTIMLAFFGTPALGEAQPAPVPPQSGRLTLEAQPFTTYDGQRHDAEFGRLWVPENRNRRGSRLIQIAFVRLRSTARQPGAPIVWLAGGPGTPGIVMARIPVYFSLFERLRSVGDVILLDQRGIGASSPALECPPSPTPADVFASERAWQATYMRKSRDCALLWRRRGVDLAGYTNDANADDVEDLRRALGAERVNLLGHSYGTVLAQAIIRRHGERVERAVLASVDGPDNLIALPREWDVGLERIAAAAPPPSPDLPGLFRRALDRLERSPAMLAVTDRATGTRRTIRVGPIGLQWLVRLDLTDARTFALLPALFESVAAGDDSLLAPRMEALFNTFQGRSPMANAVDCSLGWSAERMAVARRQANGAAFGAVNIMWTSGICGAIGVPVGNPPLSPRPRGRMPLLLLSGGLDPNTPPFQAEYVRWGFPDSSHIVIADSGHEMLPSRDVQALIVDFFKGEEVAGRTIRFEPLHFLSLEEARRLPLRGRE